MASALFKLSSDGGSSYAAAGTALADANALVYSGSGSYSIKAQLDSAAGVRSVQWTITSADDAHVASLPAVTSNPDLTCEFTVPKTGGAWLLQCKVNGGVNLATGKADPTLTRALAVKVLNSASQQEIAVGETTEAGTYGWTKAVNDVARTGGGGGGGITEAQLRTAAAALAASLDVNGQKIVDLGTPTASTDAATKGYADSHLPVVIYRQGVASPAPGQYATWAAALAAAQALPGRVVIWVDDQDDPPAIPSGTHALQQRIEVVGLCASTERIVVSVTDGAVLQDCPRLANVDLSLAINTILFTSTRDGHDIVIDNARIAETETPGSATPFNFNYTSSRLTFRNGTQVQTNINGLGEIPASKIVTAIVENATLNDAWVAGGAGTLNITFWPGNVVPDLSGFPGTLTGADLLRDALADANGDDYDFGAHKITNLADPTSAQHAATKAYVDSVSGGSFDEADLRAAAATLTASLDVNGQKVTNAGTPTTGTDLATKAYADSVVSGYVPTSRTISAGSGLTGGGDLSANRSLAVDYGSAPGAIATTGSAGAASTVSRSDHTHQAEDVTARTAASTLTGAEVLGLSQSSALRKTGLAAILGMALIFQLFGSGADGDVTVTGTTTLTRDMYYRNLTVSGAGTIRTNGFRIFVSDTLDITGAAADAIRSRASGSPDGGAGAAAGTGGSAGAAPTGTSAGIAGGAGGTAAGTQGGAATGGSGGGASGAGGAGGAGSGGAGGASRAGTGTSGYVPGLLQPLQVISTGALIAGGAGGPGGSGGGGDGTSGAGGGGGGGSGASLILCARRINRGGSTAAGAITAKGGSGGNGGSATAGNRGGGGGGGGAGGGYVLLCYAELLGSTATNAVGASGGDGGTGGDGFGTGAGGNGGAGGSSGRLVVWDLSAWTVTDTPGSAGTAGGTASGTTGGSAGTGHVLRRDL